MNMLKDDKRKQEKPEGENVSTATGNNDDDNNEGPPSLDTDMFPESASTGNGGGKPPDLNTPFFEDGNSPVEREQVKQSGEYKDMVETFGYDEPPSYQDRTEQTDQMLAQDATIDGTVESATEPASEPVPSVDGGPDSH